jgi:tRNA-specific 2-thiouridylase
VDARVVSPGSIVDAGKVVGQHDGVAGFTVGQRRGLGVALGERRYVIAVRPETSTVVLGSRAELAVRQLQLEQITWTEGPLPSGSMIDVQYRAHGRSVPAQFEGDRLSFLEPEFAVAPGQTAAMYRGDQVLGSGIVARTS